MYERVRRAVWNENQETFILTIAKLSSKLSVVNEISMVKTGVTWTSTWFQADDDECDDHFTSI